MLIGGENVGRRGGAVCHLLGSHSRGQYAYLLRIFATHKSWHVQTPQHSFSADGLF